MKYLVGGIVGSVLSLGWLVTGMIFGIAISECADKSKAERKENEA